METWNKTLAPEKTLEMNIADDILTSDLGRK